MANNRHEDFQAVPVSTQHSEVGKHPLCGFLHPSSISVAPIGSSLESQLHLLSSVDTGNGSRQAAWEALSKCKFSGSRLDYTHSNI